MYFPGEGALQVPLVGFNYMVYMSLTGIYTGLELDLNWT